MIKLSTNLKCHRIRLLYDTSMGQRPHYSRPKRTPQYLPMTINTGVFKFTDNYSSNDW